MAISFGASVGSSSKLSCALAPALLTFFDSVLPKLTIFKGLSCLFFCFLSIWLSKEELLVIRLDYFFFIWALSLGPALLLNREWVEKSASPKTEFIKVFIYPLSASQTVRYRRDSGLAEIKGSHSKERSVLEVSFLADCALLSLSFLLRY